MNKHLLSLAVIASLTACGGGGGSSSSKDPETPETPDTPDNQTTAFCEAVDNKVLLDEGQSCRLTEEQMSFINLSSDTDVVTCEDERVSFGSFNFGSLTVGSLTIACDLPEPEPVEPSALRATSTDALVTVNEDGDNFFAPTSISVVGNADALQEDSSSPQVAQVHGNLLDGEFKLELIVEDADYFDNTNVEGAVAFRFLAEDQTKEDYLADGGQTDMYILRFDDVTLENNQLTLECSYDGDLANVRCNGQRIDLSARFDALPALSQFSAYSCQVVTLDGGNQTLDCKNAIAVSVQFN